MVPDLTIVDRPCGSGKTSTLLLPSLKDGGPHLVVVPFLTEADRIVQEAPVPFVQPSDTSGTKTENLRDLLVDRQNVVVTHNLYARVALLCREGLLDGYSIHIDEVPDVCTQMEGKTSASWSEFYVGNGYVLVDTTTGKVSPTGKWDDRVEEVADTLDTRIYRAAKAGCLFLVSGTFLMWAMPEELLKSGLSIRVYTYRAEGSLLAAYLRRLKIPARHDYSVSADEVFRRQAKRLIEVKTIPSVDRSVNPRAPEFRWSMTGQDRTRRQGDLLKRVSSALRNLRRYDLKDVPVQNIMLTCPKALWEGKGGYRTGSRMGDVNWVGNTTRGTNRFIECGHLIYLWDQHINPFVRSWLGLDDRRANDEYALSELIQWVYRSRVRRGEPITLYLPSSRMRSLFQGWLDGEIERLAA